MTLKIVADENMPVVNTLFGGLGEVERLPGRALAAEQVKDADVLLVRSVTRVDSNLLENSRVRFVGSATIGTDHIDRGYLDKRGIAFANAPGCNAEAVVDYVLATLCRLQPNWLDARVAIIGCGNVGGRLYRRLRALGVTCLCYDPFLDVSEQPDLVSFEDVLKADVLCLHTPLTTTGPYPSYHLLSGRVLAKLAPDTLIINAGRGGAIDTSALLPLLQKGYLRAALDVWEGEPAIDGTLLRQVDQGTPHIAGYSLEGRIRGSTMVYEALCKWLGCEATIPALETLAAEVTGRDSSQPLLNAGEVGAGEGPEEALASTVLAAYNPARDHRALVGALKSASGLAGEFDRLRKDYPMRREFSYFQVHETASSALNRQFRALGFQLQQPGKLAGG